MWPKVRLTLEIIVTLCTIILSIEKTIKLFTPAHQPPRDTMVFGNGENIQVNK